MIAGLGVDVQTESRLKRWHPHQSLDPQPYQKVGKTAVRQQVQTEKEFGVKLTRTWMVTRSNLTKKRLRCKVRPHCRHA